MIVLLVVILLIVIFLAFFLGNNLSNVCSFWFFHTYTNVPVLVLIFASFAAGIVFSLLIIALGKKKIKKHNDKTQVMDQENNTDK